MYTTTRICTVFLPSPIFIILILNWLITASRALNYWLWDTAISNIKNSQMYQCLCQGMVPIRNQQYYTTVRLSKAFQRPGTKVQHPGTFWDCWSLYNNIMHESAAYSYPVKDICNSSNGCRVYIIAPCTCTDMLIWCTQYYTTAVYYVIACNVYILVVTPQLATDHAGFTALACKLSQKLQRATQVQSIECFCTSVLHLW